MTNKKASIPQDASRYNGAITREQFLFYEMRTMAKLLNNGLNNEAAVERIMSENLFQYPSTNCFSKENA